VTTQSPQWVETARLLRRIGFGTSGQQVDAVVTEGWPVYLSRVLGADPDADPGASGTPLPQFPVLRAPGKAATPQARKDHNRQLNDQLSELSAWWIRRMVAVEQPEHEKLTLMWHNHFATSAAKVRTAQYMVIQNQTLRTLKLGDFRDLAYAMLTDAAMLRWLDGQSNTAKAANENLAREFMELFALGHGNGYTETDVRDGARALTGWTLSPAGQPTPIPRRHDASAKTVLGVTGNLDAAGFCDAVLAQPKSASYIAARLWQQLASDTPPSAAALDRLVAAYGSGRDLKALTTAILTDPEVTGAHATIIVTPAEWLVGVIRSLRVAVDTPKQAKLIQSALKTLGQQPFYPPDVGGWPHGQAWLSTASAGVRLQTAARLIDDGDLSSVTDTAPSDRIDAVGYLLGVGAWSDRTVAALTPLIATPPQLVTTAVNTPEYLTS
jgi:uncharacterized protein (DUF1800 family)